ncbi:MAG: hypothetical protein OHK0053_00470 [Microscillaceae bacterium]
MVRILEANAVLPSPLLDQLAEDGLRIMAQRSLEKIYISACNSFQAWFINAQDFNIWLYRPVECAFEVWQANQDHQSAEKKQVDETQVPSMGQDCFFAAKALRWQSRSEGVLSLISVYQPIFFQQEILGFISLRLEGEQINPLQKQILQHLSLYVSQAIGHAQTYLTLQARNEEIIRQSQEFQSLIRVMPQSLFRTDTEGRLTFANQAFQQLIGIKLENLLGREAYSLYLPELGEIFKADDQWVMAHLENLEATRVLQTGPYTEPVFVQMVKSPILDFYNRIVGVQTTFWDVTERQKNQDQLRLQKVEIRQQARKLTQMNRELEQKQREIKMINARLETELQRQLNQIQRTREELDIFLYRASHDLRRPVTTLMGLAQVARLTLENEEAAQLFEKVDTTAQAMDQMLAKLLMVSEIHHASGLPQPIDFEALIEGLHQEYQELLLRNAVRWEVEIDSALQFTSFPILLTMVLRNLIENSMQFRRCDGAEIPYIKIRIYQKNALLHILLEDNGQGIPTLWQKKVFGMYVKANRFSKGNGLGLYVVKKAVHRLGGQVALSSYENQFTRVHIILPPYDQTPIGTRTDTKTPDWAVGEAPTVEKAKLIMQTEALEKELHLLKKLNQSKDQFLKILSRDFKRPLKSLFKFAQHIHRQLPKLPSHEIQDLGLQLEQATQQFYKMVDNLFLLTLLQLGEMEINPEPIALTELLGQVIQRAQGDLISKKLRIDSQIQAQTLMADRTILENILANLLYNAIQYSPPEAEIRLLQEQQPEFLLLHFEDQGPGLSEEVQAHLFQQMDLEATSDARKGLGLILCQQFIEKMGGQIQVKSQLGQGSRFTIFLPLRGHA